MTGDPLLDLGISVVAVGLLVAFCAALGGWRTARLRDAADAAGRWGAEGEEPMERWILRADGRVALGRAGARAGVLVVLGDGTAARRLPADAVRVEGPDLRVDLGDAAFPALRLPGAAAEW